MQLDKIYEKHNNIDILIGADVLFWPDSIKPLVELIYTMTLKNPKLLIILSCKKRVSNVE